MAILFRDRNEAGRPVGRAAGGEAETGSTDRAGDPAGRRFSRFPGSAKVADTAGRFPGSKAGRSGQEELAFGAVSLGGEPFLDEQVIRSAGISQEQIGRIAAKAVAMLERRAELYRGERAAIEVAGSRWCWWTMGLRLGRACFQRSGRCGRWGRRGWWSRFRLAPASTCRWLRGEVDELVCLHAPEEFYAVGQFYGDFGAVGDEEVTSLLRRAQAQRW